MNLDLLTKGTPNQKPWLNISCSDLTCNDSSTAVNNVSKKVFRMSTPRGNYLTLPASTFAPCTLVTYGNPNIELSPLNAYTANKAEYLFINISYFIFSPVITATAQTNINVFVNSLFSGIAGRQKITGSGGDYSIQCSGLLRLQKDDVVTINFINEGFDTGSTYNDFVFSGYVI